MKEDRVFKRGEIYLASLMQCNNLFPLTLKPVLILQNNDGMFSCPTLIVVPMNPRMLGNTSLKDGMKHLGNPDISPDQITRIDKRQIRSYLGIIADGVLDETNDILSEKYGIYVPEEIEAP